MLLGANGAGKTTCLKLLIGDLEPEVTYWPTYWRTYWPTYFVRPRDLYSSHAVTPFLQEGVGETWMHHHLRVSYIAQHSLHHLEDYLQAPLLLYLLLTPAPLLIIISFGGGVYAENYRSLDTIR